MVEFFDPRFAERQAGKGGGAQEAAVPANQALINDDELPPVGEPGPQKDWKKVVKQAAIKQKSVPTNQQSRVSYRPKGSMLLMIKVMTCIYMHISLRRLLRLLSYSKQRAVDMFLGAGESYRRFQVTPKIY
nr:hypothetical protein [Marinobacter salarius]